MKSIQSLVRDQRRTPEHVYFRGGCIAQAGSTLNYVIDTGLADRSDRALRLHYIELEIGVLPSGVNFTVGEHVAWQLQRRFTAVPAFVAITQREHLWQYLLRKQDETQVGWQYFVEPIRFWWEMDEPDSLIVQSEIAVVSSTNAGDNTVASFKLFGEYIPISQLDKVELIAAQS